MNLSKEIYRPYGRGLGDCIGDLNYYSFLSKQKNEIIQLSLWYEKFKKQKWAWNISEVYPLLKEQERISLTKEGSNQNKNTLVPDCVFIKSTIQWKPNNSKKICYNFSGKSNKKHQNFPSLEIENSVVNDIKKLGYEMIRVGFPINLKDSLSTMSNCELFLGIDSGLAYLAAMARIPIVFVQNRINDSHFRILHKTKCFCLAKNDIELVEFMKKYQQDKFHFLRSIKREYIFKDTILEMENLFI